MSAGPGTAEGVLPGPAPRSVTLMRLERELFHARDARADAYAAQIEAEMARLSRGSAADPRTETTSARRRPAARTRRKT